MCYAYFMLIVDISEDFLQNDYGFSCVAGATEITGQSSITQDRRIDLPEFFGHSLEEEATGSKSKISVAALSYIQ